MKKRLTESIEDDEPPGQVEPTDIKGSPIEALSELFNEIEREAVAHRERLQTILDEHAFTRLASGQELREFRRLFKAVTERIGVRPVLPDGTPASLQVHQDTSGQAWPSLQSRHGKSAGGVPANTIPELTVRPISR